MSVAVTDTRAPRPPGSRFHAHTALTPKTRKHAPGRVCATPGCGTILRSTNPDQTCDPCQRKARRTRDAQKAAKAVKRGAVATAAGSAGTKASSPSRPKKEAKVTPERPTTASAAAVLGQLVTGEYVSGAEIATSRGISRNAVNKQVQSLRRLGWRIDAAPRRGMMLIDEKPWETSESAPAPSTGAAPEHLREQTSDAAAPDSAGPALQASPASGGFGHPRLRLHARGLVHSPVVESVSAMLRGRRKVWATPEDAAETLGVSLWTVRRMLREGQLRGRKLKSGRWQVLASGLRKDGGR